MVRSDVTGSMVGEEGITVGGTEEGTIDDDRTEGTVDGILDGRIVAATEG
jgi:hypothetical protein